MTFVPYSEEDATQENSYHLRNLLHVGGLSLSPFLSGDDIATSDKREMVLQKMKNQVKVDKGM